MTDFFNRFCCELDSKYSMILEDDGRVCYAYLMKGNEIIGDVWLYNSQDTPDKVDWSKQEDLPFLNSAAYVDQNRTPEMIRNSKDVNIEWIMSKEGLTEANIFINEKFVAKLKPGQKPGWSVNALNSGPLAQALY